MLFQSVVIAFSKIFKCYYDKIIENQKALQMMIFKRFLITASLLLLLGGCGESVFDKCVKGEKEKAVAKYYMDIHMLT